jgi:hypothetical protein
MAENLNDNEKMSSIIQDCNVIIGVSKALSETFRDCLIDLNAGIIKDNYGSQSYIEGRFNTLLDSVEIVNESGELAVSIMDVFNKTLK